MGSGQDAHSGQTTISHGDSNRWPAETIGDPAQRDLAAAAAVAQRVRARRRDRTPPGLRASFADLTQAHCMERAEARQSSTSEEFSELLALPSGDTEQVE